MSNRITRRDREVMKYVEEYGFITTNQMSKIWLENHNTRYNIATKRLNALVNLGYLKTRKNKFGTQIYFIDYQYANPSEHMMTIMDCYSALKNIGVDVVHFKREQKWIDGKFRSDAFIIAKLSHYVFPICLEVSDKTSTVLSRKAYEDKLNYKYNTILQSNEPTELYNKIRNESQEYVVPIVLIADTLFDETRESYKLKKVISETVNFDYEKLVKLFLKINIM